MWVLGMSAFSLKLVGSLAQWEALGSCAELSAGAAWSDVGVSSRCNRKSMEGVLDITPLPSPPAACIDTRGLHGAPETCQNKH